MQFKHCCYEKVNGFYEIIVPDYPQYNTTCATLEEAEKICRLIDRIIQFIKNERLWNNIKRKKLQQIIKLRQLALLQRQLEDFKRQKEFYEKQRELIQRIEEDLRQSREKYLRQLEELLEELSQETESMSHGMH